MLNINQIAQALRHQKLKSFSQEVGVSIYLLTKMRDSDATVPYSELKKVSDYFEGEEKD